MGFKCGIVGLPNVGKSTLFSALTETEVPMENYPFCTIDPHTGVVPVPDERLDLLAKIYQPQKVIPTTLQFVDLAGLVEGASQGEGLGNQFLSQIQSVDAIIHLIRCFEDPNVAHIDARLDPQRDFEIVDQEIIKKDLEIVENRIQKISKQTKSGNQKAEKQLQILTELQTLLAKGQSAKTYHAHPEAENFIKELGLLSRKPVLILGNISEDDATAIEKSELVRNFGEFAVRTGNYFMTLSANLELELAQLDPDEKKEFMRELGVAEIGLNKLVSAGYTLLNLITFFSMESNICQAWTVKKNTPAQQAAGVIHSSFSERFIKAEVRHWPDVAKARSEQTLRAQGHVHVEGKSYILRDGDVITFKLAAG